MFDQTDGWIDAVCLCECTQEWVCIVVSNGIVMIAQKIFDSCLYRTYDILLSSESIGIVSLPNNWTLNGNFNFNLIITKFTYQEGVANSFVSVRRIAWDSQ